MSKIQQMTDQELLQRAGHAGRNLIALAILGSLFLLFIFAFVCLSPPSEVGMAGLMVLVIAAAWPCGLWLLAIAARRGNPTAVGVVMAIMALQVLLSIAGFVLMTVRHMDTGEGSPHLLFPLIGIIVIATLAGSRNVLLEMKKRGLWEQRFVPAAGRRLCLIGGVLFVAGHVGMLASLLFPAISAAKRAVGEKEHASAFIRVIKGKESELMTLMAALGSGGPEAVKAAIAKVDALDQEIKSLQSAVAADSPLSPILAKYREAVSKWRSGLTELEGPTPDPEKAKDLIIGDKLRNEAGEEFDRKYARPKPRGR